MKKVLLSILTITVLGYNANAQCTIANQSIVEDFNAGVWPTCWTGIGLAAISTDKIRIASYYQSPASTFVFPKTVNAKGIVNFIAQNTTNGQQGYGDVTVGAVSDPTNMASFVPITTVNIYPTISGNQIVYAPYSVDLSSYTGSFQYIVFTMPGGSSYSKNIYIDNINYESGCISASVNAIAQDATFQLNSNGNVSILPADIDNGSTSDCAPPTLSIDISEFDCSDIGVNVVTLTATDNQGATSSATANVTIQSPFNDEAVSATQSSVCLGNSTAINTASSVSGMDYYLRNDLNDAIVDGPISGTGNALSFSTGNLNTATTYNVYADIPTEPQGALSFDGASGYADIGAGNRSITTQISIETWVKTTSTTAKLFVSKYTGALGVYMQMNADGKVWIIGRDGVGPKNSGTSTTAINDNQWHHVVGTVNVTTGMWRIYVDGVDESPTPSSGAGTTLASTSPFYLGANSLSGDVFDGIFDKVVIWNIELDPTTIASNADGCISEDTPGVVGYFDLNEGAGTTITDKSGNGNGTLISMNPATDWVAGQNITCSVPSCNLEMTQTVTVTIGSSYNQTAAATVCNGESFTFPDGSIQSITSQVVHTSNLTTVIAGCDSIIETTVDVNPSYNLTEAASICSGESYLFPDGTTQQNITSQVVYTSNLQTVGTQCDSIIETTVNVNPSYDLTETETVCEGGNFTFPDGTTQQNITSQVVYTSNLATVGTQCDSIIETTVDVITVDVTTSQIGGTLTATQTGATYQWVDCDNGNAAINGAENQDFSPTSSGNYAVEVTVNGCTETSGCTNMIVTGIKDETTSSVSVYPVPTSGVLNIKSNTIIEEVSIYAVDGSLVRTFSQNPQSIDVSELVNGMYLLITRTEDGVSQSKFVKE